SRCRIGWGGETCEECKPLNGCKNGYCTQPLECRCHEGWTGPLCQIPICAANCSTSHGSCNKPGECRCEVGWWGDTCNECFAYPGCQHGYCTKPWECVCEEGWEGITCDKRPRRKTSYCDRNQSACLNGGTCINVPGNRNFTCSCPSLFTGQRCEYLADSPFTTSTTLPTLPTTIPVITTPANAQFFTSDFVSPRENYSLVQQNSNATNPKVLSEARRLYEESDDLNRKIFLQNNARIIFRTPKISSAEDSNGNKVPLKVIDRKLLPLPVFLPRVQEILPNKQSQKEEGREPTPVFLFDFDNEESFEQLGRNQIGENRRFLRHQEDSPDYVYTDLIEAESNEKRRPSQQRIVRVNSFNRPFMVSAGATALPRLNPFFSSTLRQPVTEKQKPVDLMQSNEQDKPTTSTLPKTTPSMPVTTTSSIPKTTPKAPSRPVTTTTSITKATTRAPSRPVTTTTSITKATPRAPSRPVTTTSSIPKTTTRVSSRAVTTTSSIPKTSPRAPPRPVIKISAIPQTTPRTPVTITLRTKLQEEIFEIQESRMLPQSNADRDHSDALRDHNSALQVHREEVLGGGVHIGALDLKPHESKDFVYEAFIELRKV
ncbi:unnamed protein product, partial [Meganyctiphanes norvegica]